MVCCIVHAKKIRPLEHKRRVHLWVRRRGAACRGGAPGTARPLPHARARACGCRLSDPGRGSCRAPCPCPCRGPCRGPAGCPLNPPLAAQSACCPCRCRCGHAPASGLTPCRPRPHPPASAVHRCSFPARPLHLLRRWPLCASRAHCQEGRWRSRPCHCVPGAVSGSCMLHQWVVSSAT